MADLITSTRAKVNINQTSFTTAEDSAIDTLVTSVSGAVKRYCRREFDNQAFDELYGGTGDEILVLNQYPLVSVTRVAGSPLPVLTIRNTSASNQRATVAVTSTGLSLTRVASGVSSTDTSITWSSYPTLQAVKTAVDAMGNGWSADIPESTYQLWASADLHAPQGSLQARDVDAPLLLHGEEIADYTVDAARGWLIRPGSCWSPGHDNYRILYNAGYATIPEEVQEACAQWVASLFWQTKDNPALSPDQPSASILFLLDPYRRYCV